MKDIVTAFDEIRDDEYSEAVEAKELGRLVIDSVNEHAHLLHATIGYVFRDDELRRHGRVVAAEAILTERILQADRRWSRFVKWSLQRVLSGNLPDFLVLIDRNIWSGLGPEEKLALVDHELSHCTQANDDDGIPKFHKDGRPVWSIKAHDFEDFTGVIERNGLWNEELVEMARAVIDTLAAQRKGAAA